MEPKSDFLWKFNKNDKSLVLPIMKKKNNSKLPLLGIKMETSSYLLKISKVQQSINKF